MRCFFIVIGQVQGKDQERKNVFLLVRKIMQRRVFRTKHFPGETEESTESLLQA